MRRLRLLVSLLVRNGNYMRRLGTKMWKVSGLMYKKLKFNWLNKSQNVLFQFCLFVKNLFFSDRVVTLIPSRDVDPA